MNKRSVQYLFLGTLLTLFLGAFSASSALAARVTDVAWAQFDGQRFEIYYGHLSGGQLQEKIQVTNDPYNNMHPSMIQKGNELWLAWTAMNGANNKLFFSRRANGSWSFPAEIETGLQSSIAPFLALDARGTVWVTWAGFNGKNDDVYVSHWENGQWSAPVRVNPANETPDIVPTLEREKNTLVVKWQGYDGNQYQYYRSRLENGQWSPPQRETAEQKQARESRQQQHDELQAALPPEIKPVGKAALLVQ